MQKKTSALVLSQCRRLFLASSILLQHLLPRPARPATSALTGRKITWLDFLVDVDQHFIVAGKLAAQDAHRERALDVLLQGAAQGAGAKGRSRSPRRPASCGPRRSAPPSGRARSGAPAPLSSAGPRSAIICSRLSAEKVMISSMRLRNSGRKVLLSAFSIFSCDGARRRRRSAARSPGCRTCARTRCPGCWS